MDSLPTLFERRRTKSLVTSIFRCQDRLLAESRAPRTRLLLSKNNRYRQGGMDWLVEVEDGKGREGVQFYGRKTVPRIEGIELLMSGTKRNGFTFIVEQGSDPETFLYRSGSRWRMSDQGSKSSHTVHILDHRMGVSNPGQNPFNLVGEFARLRCIQPNIGSRSPQNPESQNDGLGNRHRRLPVVRMHDERCSGRVRWGCFEAKDSSGSLRFSRRRTPCGGETSPKQRSNDRCP